MDTTIDITPGEAMLAGMTDFYGNSISKDVLDLAKSLLQQNPSASKSRLQFIERLPLLPKEILDGLKAGKIQIVDFVGYGTRSVEAVNTVDMFKSDDAKSTGFCNIIQSKLDKGRVMVLSSIQLLYHNGASAITSSNVGTFTPTVAPASVLNGELSLRYGGKDIIKEMPIGTLFPGLHPSNTSVPGMTEDTDASQQDAYTLYPSFAYATNKPYGLLELDNPKLISDEEISVKLDFAQALASGSHHAFKFFLRGTGIRAN